MTDQATAAPILQNQTIRGRIARQRTMQGTMSRKHAALHTTLVRAGLQVAPGWLTGPGGMRWQAQRVITVAAPRRELTGESIRWLFDHGLIDETEIADARQHAADLEFGLLSNEAAGRYGTPPSASDSGLLIDIGPRPVDLA